MAKKKAATGQKSIMEQLQEYRPPWEEPAEEKKDADPNAGLLERLAKLEGELAESRRQQAFQGFASSTQTTQAKVEPKRDSFEVDLKGLPDPVSHPDKYSEEYAKRIQAAVDRRMDAERSAMAQQQERAGLAQRVWDGFKAAQPDWAKHELLVQAAAGKISNDMAAKGVDMEKLLKQQPDLFYGEVTSLLEKQYPQLKGEKSEEDDDTTHRTAGVFGGTPGKASGGDEPPSSMEDNEAFLRSLAEVRYKSGVR